MKKCQHLIEIQRSMNRSFQEVYHLWKLGQRNRDEITPSASAIPSNSSNFAFSTPHTSNGEPRAKSRQQKALNKDLNSSMMSLVSNNTISSSVATLKDSESILDDSETKNFAQASSNDSGFDSRKTVAFPMKSIAPKNILASNF